MNQEKTSGMTQIMGFWRRPFLRFFMMNANSKGAEINYIPEN